MTDMVGGSKEDMAEGLKEESTTCANEYAIHARVSYNTPRNTCTRRTLQLAAHLHVLSNTTRNNMQHVVGVAQLQLAMCAIRAANKDVYVDGCGPDVPMAMYRPVQRHVCRHVSGY